MVNPFTDARAVELVPNSIQNPVVFEGTQTALFLFPAGQDRLTLENLSGKKDQDAIDQQQKQRADQD
jgi:hypothetical protein